MKRKTGTRATAFAAQPAEREAIVNVQMLGIA
jgi:hypothetical protein